MDANNSTSPMKNEGKWEELMGDDLKMKVNS